MLNFRITTTSAYRNPYSPFINGNGKHDPLRFMKRFSADVEPPRNQEHPGNEDPLTPMRRFKKDVSPPRYSQTGENIFRRHNTSGNTIWKMNAGGNDERNAAINAYQKIKNPYTIGSQLNIFNR